MKTQYLIVGQGIAGSTLARALMQRNQEVMVIDDGHKHSSSTKAAGTVNPITGRRYVKTWLCDTLLPFAKHYYQEAEKEFGQRFFYPRNIAFVFSSVTMQNDWLLRPETKESDYVEQPTDIELYKSELHDVVGGVEFGGGGRIDMPLFMDCVQKTLRQEQRYREESFDYEVLEIDKDVVRYKDIVAQNIIFCEGAQAASQNPYFRQLPFNLAKGEILLVKIPNYSLHNKLVKHKQLFIIQLQQDLYWVGSAYIRQFQDDQPTAAERQALEMQLQEILKIPFEVIGHWAGVRPTVKDRRPFIGQHPSHHNVFIFNGLGAKGSYAAPFFAEHFVAHLLEGLPLMREADIKRI